MIQSSSSKPGLIHGLGLVSMVVPMTLPLSAQSTWNGTTSANWSIATNWNPGIPASGDNIIIADTTANQLTLNDGSHAVGSIAIGTTGTRTSGFTLQTNTANTLTITGGVTANGNFTAGIGARLRGNLLISAAQTWQVGGEAGGPSVDRGIAVNEVSSGNFGSLTLNANLNKSGTGQLTLAAINVSGASDFNVNDGSLKLNAGGSMLLTVAGTGKIAVNNSATLILSKNSGTFSISRPFQFNNTATVSTGGTFATAGTWDVLSNMEWNGTHTITLANSTGAGTPAMNYRFTGVMSGTGSVTKNGASQLILSGTSANTLGGQVTVAAGELMLDKTGAIAVPGNILVTGGTLRVNQSHQIADTSSITVTGGVLGYTAARAETIASLNISSGATSSVSGYTVTGATTLSAGLHQLNSGETFTTSSLSLSNNAALQLVGNATAPASSTINVGAGGLTLNTGRVLYGNPGNTTTTQVNLSGNVVSTGTSLFSAANYNGARILNLQAGSRSFAVDSGTLDIATTIENGTLVKSGAGTLILSRPGSTADFSFTEGPVQIVSQVNAANLSLSGGSLLMDVGGATPAKITTSGNFTATGGTIELTAANGAITPGVLELVRYSGTFTGTPEIAIPAQLAASRMAPLVDYGTRTDSAITLTSTAVPLSLTWQGSTGGLWNTTTTNFNGGSEKFYELDSVTFDDTGANPSILLNSVVFPADVVFNHGATVGTYTLSGTGSINGPTKLTKSGTGTTILATDNHYTGATDILGGTLQIGNGGLTGSLGSGAVLVDFGTTLAFARDGVAVVPNVISGTGTILNSGPGTVALTANSTGFTGDVSITGGTLQFGDGGADGSLGTAPIAIGSGATFAIKRTGTPTVANNLSGAGQLAVTGGSPILTGSNTHTGGVSVSEGGVVRLTSDAALGEFPLSLDPDAIRLDHGGLKNQDSFTTTDIFRGVTVTGEAYFTAGWTKSLTISGPISGTGDVFINHDNGTVLFTDPTSNWNGILTLGADKPGFAGATGGNLEISTITNGGVAGPLGIASADPANLVFNGGRLIFSGTGGSTDRGFTLQGAGSFSVIADTTLAMNGLATGPGALTKVGDGTLVLSANNDFAGNVVVDDGVVSLTHTNALGVAAKTLVVAGDAGGNRIPELQLSGGIAPLVADLDISGAGVGNLTGALHNVSGDNTLTVANDVTLRTGNGNTTLYSSSGTLILNTPLVTSNATGRQLILAGPGNGVINGVIANGTTANLPVIKNGSGLWTLNGAHTYTGATTVNAGVLSLGQAALNDTAAVVIAAGAVLDLNFTGIDEVGSLTIGIDPPLPNDVYSAATHPGIITGTGSIRVGPDPAGYTTWAAGYPFTVGVNDGIDHDPDFDGINNLLEYVLGGVPVGAGASDTSILPTQSLTTSNLVLTFRRSDASEGDVTLKVQWSDSLGTWNDFATIGPIDALPAVDVTEDSPTTAIDTVKVTIPRNITPSSKLFVRVQAIK